MYVYVSISFLVKQLERERVHELIQGDNYLYIPVYTPRQTRLFAYIESCWLFAHNESKAHVESVRKEEGGLYKRDKLHKDERKTEGSSKNERKNCPRFNHQQLMHSHSQHHQQDVH